MTQERRLDTQRIHSTMPPPEQVQSLAAEERRLSQTRAHPAAYPHHAVAVPCCPCLPSARHRIPCAVGRAGICAVNATKGGERQLRERTPLAAMHVQGEGVVMSATPHPIAQRERSHTAQQDRRDQQSPRRERRCRCRITRARPDLSRQIAAHQRIGTGGVAADSVNAVAGHALGRSGAPRAVRLWRRRRGRRRRGGRCTCWRGGRGWCECGCRGRRTHRFVRAAAEFTDAAPATHVAAVTHVAGAARLCNAAAGLAVGPSADVAGGARRARAA